MLSTRMLTATLALTVGAIAIAATGPSTFSQDPEQASDHHRRVLQGVGTWEGTLTSFVPDAPAQTIAAREHVEAVGEFWTRSRFECEFMGTPYVGAGCFGYSAAEKKYVGTWTNSNSSHLAVMEGEFDPKSDLLVMRWQAPDESGKISPHRYELAMRDDRYTSTFYVGEGEGVKTMTLEMKRKNEPAPMHVDYLEIVTPDVAAFCATYERLHGVTFSEPVATLGGARTASLSAGGTIGVRAPLRETETPVVRPYLLVDDIEAATKAAAKSGGKIAHPPMLLPGHGTFAIFIQGGIESGLWQRQ